MRYFLHVMLFVLVSTIFGGCTRTNAFTKFHLSPIQERADSSLRSSKLSNCNENIGIVSSIYLNEVDLKKYNGMEYFYIELYTKDGETLYDPNLLEEKKMHIKLNGHDPIKIAKLDKENSFKTLMPFDNQWNQYYLVAFQKSESEKLSLKLEDGRFDSLPLEYQKSEQ